jgi:hypothetical protein
VVTTGGKGRPGRPVEPNSARQRARSIIVAGLVAGDRPRIIIGRMMDELGIKLTTARQYYYKWHSLPSTQRTVLEESTEDDDVAVLEPSHE